MTILILHNRYKLHGGEDVVVQQEAKMLGAAGHAVDVMEVLNDDIEGMVSKAKTALSSIYSSASRDLVASRIRRTRAEILHVHNFFPKLTPAVYDAVRGLNCAVVQTLHNYRLVCPGGLLFRDGKICEDCLGKSFAFPAIEHSCYRDSKIGSATIASMNAFHAMRGTWSERVHRFIALNDYAKKIFISYGGFPANRVRMKPNAIPDSGIGARLGHYALFVGRLSPEKGIRTLLHAAQNERFPVPVKVVGTGPLEGEVREAAAKSTKIEFLGHQQREQVVDLVKNALVQIVPSEWHEAGGPLVIGEAFSAGVPVVTPNLEPMSSVVQHGVCGLLYRAGDGDDLCRAVSEMLQDQDRLVSMREKARHRYEALYLPENNLKTLVDIYQEARQTLGRS